MSVKTNYWYFVHLIVSTSIADCTMFENDHKKIHSLFNSVLFTAHNMYVYQIKETVFLYGYRIKAQ